MALVDFTFNPDLTAEFLRFGEELYRGDPHWIQPLRADLVAQFSPDSPFYQVPENRHRHFLVKREGQVMGRISAFVNAAMHDADGTAVAAIGFFESRNDDTVAEELFTAAITWLGQESKAAKIRGPMNFDIWHAYRLMIRGFEERTFYGEPYNKPYYRQMFLNNGFQEQYLWDTVEVTGQPTLARLAARYRERLTMLTGHGYRCRPFDLHRLHNEIGTLHEVLSRSFGGFLCFTPIDLSNFEALFAPRLRWALHPRLCYFWYDSQGLVAGFAAAFLELSQAIRVLKGGSGFLGKIRFLLKRRRVDTINFFISGITPEEKRKRSGLGGAMFSHVVGNILDLGFERLLVPLMVKDNLAHRFLVHDAPPATREYALYEYNR
nr:hypothetical protein [uncultured Desulfobulbus sp.]